MTHVETGLDDPRSLAALVLSEETRRQEAEAARETSISHLLEDPANAEPEPPLSEVLAIGGKRIITVLFGVALLDSVDTAAFGVLAPDIRNSLGASTATISIIAAIAGVTVSLAALPLGTLGDRKRRATIAGVSVAVWAAASVLTGFVNAVWQLALLRGVAGVGKANEGPIQGSMLADAYPPAGRGRIFGIHRSALPLGILIGPLLVGAVASIAGGDNGWRYAFVLLAIPGVPLAIATLRLPEPLRGRFEREALEVGEVEPDAQALPIGLGAAFARLKKVRTFYSIMTALGAFGVGVVTVPIYLNLLLEDKYGQSVGQRGVLAAIGAVGALAGAVAGGVYADRLFRSRPERTMYLVAVGLALLGFGFALQAYSPNLVIYTIVGILTQGLLFAALVPMSLMVAAVTPFEFRSTGFALVGLYLALVGGLGGAVIMGIADNAYGTRAAVALVAPTATIIAGFVLARAAKFVRADVARAAQDVIEERDEQIRAASSGDQPLLQVRHLDFSYGPVQVLFDVNIDVREGEVLALLGTNGAGKSTLLRAISGLSYADRGSVRLAGRTITFADPTARVKMGIVQVPGGKAVYPSLTVADNLLIGGYTLLKDHAGLENRIAAALENFPMLTERLDQLAGTLSGGEQQMLGLATAMILKPQILCIDELSLGLAPVMVQQVLATVDRLKAQGLTMIIVEQSINVALAISDRAVFMEKGQVKFEGPAKELAERDDLVRAVFLGGGQGG